MPYELMTKGGHVCTLPDPGAFDSGDVIQCRDIVLRDGYRGECGRRYWRCTKFWGNRPYWNADFSW